MGVPRKAVLGMLVWLIFCVQNLVNASQANLPAFSALCSLIKLTEKNVTLPASLEPSASVRSDLIDLNLTTSADDWYDLFSGREEAWPKARTTEKFKAQEKNEQWGKMYPDWDRAKKRLLDDAAKTKEEEKKYTRPPAGYRRQIANMKIRRIWKNYEAVEGERQELKKTLENKKEEIEKAFRLARTNRADGTVEGEANKEYQTEKTFQHNAMATACGGTGDSAAGISLANDLTCLCSSADGAQDDRVCLTSTTDVAAWTTGGNGKTNYEKIRPLCPTTEEATEPTPHTIQKLLRKFFHLLGKGDGAAHVNGYVLGGTASAGGSGCTGSTGPAYVCVNYKKNLVTDGPGIPWVRQLEKATELLEDLSDQEKKVNALNAREEALREAAWIAYEEAKLPDETNSAGGTETSQAGKAEKATATGSGELPTTGGEGRPTGSAASITRFILPWTLVI